MKTIQKQKDGTYKIIVQVSELPVEEIKYAGHFVVELSPKKNKEGSKLSYDHSVNLVEEKPFSANAIAINYEKDIPVSVKSEIESEAIEMALEQFYNYQYSKAS